MKKITLLLSAVFVLSAAALYAQSAQTYLNSGKYSFNRKDYDEAIQALNEAIRLDPNMAEAYAYRSWAYGRKNNNDQSLSDANRAIQLNPQLGIGYFVRGRLQSDNDRAIADYNEAIRLNCTLAYNNRGVKYANKKDYDRAIADYNEAIKHDPNDPLPYLNRGVAYYNKKDYDRAIADYDKVFWLRPDSETLATLYRNLGHAHKARGDAYKNNGKDKSAVDAEYNEADSDFRAAREHEELARREKIKPTTIDLTPFLDMAIENVLGGGGRSSSSSSSGSGGAKLDYWVEGYCDVTDRQGKTQRYNIKKAVKATSEVDARQQVESAIRSEYPTANNINITRVHR